MRKWNEWSSEETQFLLDNYNLLTNKQLEDHFTNRTWSTIYSKAKKLGLYRDKNIEFKNRSAARSGEKNSSWNGGRMQNKAGYILVLKKGHHHSDKKGYVMEHIYVWENETGLEVPPGCCIHHLNGNKQDNRIENLCLMSHKAHTIFHHTGLHRSYETRLKISEKARARHAK